LSAVIEQHRPDTAVLEMVFTHQAYVHTASLMAHARGVACLAAREHGVPLVEYPTARVKQAVTGRGGATKEQVARMVAQWLGLREPSWSFDASDALALAIAHVHMAAHQPAVAG
jgi:crossover junction endodeoxyribonuclease RuvC